METGLTKTGLFLAKENQSMREIGHQGESLWLASKMEGATWQRMQVAPRSYEQTLADHGKEMGTSVP